MNENSFERVMKVLNQMKEKGLITTYAIGGGFATIYYTEPFSTEDVDIFVLVPIEREKSIDCLKDIYSYLTEEKGYPKEGLYIRVEGELVQFIAADEPPLFREAVENAFDIGFGQEPTPTRILTAEYLIAMMLFAGTTKHFLRVTMLLEQKLDLDRDKLNDIIKSHSLTEQWARYEKTIQ